MIEMGVIKGDALYYEIALNEEQILEDGIYDLSKIYDYMDEVFSANDCWLAGIEGRKRIYTRDKDAKDLQCLWMAVNAFDETRWFEKYACHYMFYPCDEEEEDWLEGSHIPLRRALRSGAEKIITNMKAMNGILRSSNVVKYLLSDTSYKSIEEDEFILFHQKDLNDYQTGVRLITVSLEPCKIAVIASLICLMQKNEFPDTVVVAFLKDTGKRENGIQKLVKLLKKTKRTYRAIVLDVTNTGWEEECDYTVENCYLTRRMYSNLKSVLVGPFTGGSREWKIIPEDRQLLKGILYTDKCFATNAPRGKECDFFQECGVKCFSFCLPVEEKFESGEPITIDMYRLGWYMHKLIYLSKEKI